MDILFHHLVVYILIMLPWLIQTNNDDKKVNLNRIEAFLVYQFYLQVLKVYNLKEYKE
jgi:hypothetical protein